MLKGVVSAVFTLFSLGAQAPIDVFENKVFVPQSKQLSIYRWDGKYLKDLPALPEIIGHPRPKFRVEKWWISNGKKVGLLEGKKIKWLTLPEEIEQFTDFDIIDSNSILLWGVQWKIKKELKEIGIEPESYPFLAIIDLAKGSIVGKYFAPPRRALDSFFDSVLEYEGYCLKYENMYVFVGKYSGKLRFYESDKIKHWEIQCIDPKWLPTDPNIGVNSGEFIPSVYPIEGGELLLHVRWWLPKSEHAPATKQDWFQILDPVNKKLGEAQLSHRDRTPGKTQFWVDGSGRTHTLR